MSGFNLLAGSVKSLLTLHLDPAVLNGANGSLAYATAVACRKIAQTEVGPLVRIRANYPKALAAADAFALSPTADSVADFKGMVFEIFAECDTRRVGAAAHSASDGDWFTRSMLSEFKRLSSAESSAAPLQRHFSGERWEVPALLAQLLTDLILRLAENPSAASSLANTATAGGGDGDDDESVSGDPLLQTLLWLVAGDGGGGDFGGLVELLGFGDGPHATSGAHRLAGTLNRLVASNDPPGACVEQLLTLLSSESEEALLSAVARLARVRVAVFDLAPLDADGSAKRVDALKEFLAHKYSDAKMAATLSALRAVSDTLSKPLQLLHKAANVLLKAAGFAELAPGAFAQVELRHAIEVGLKHMASEASSLRAELAAGAGNQLLDPRVARLVHLSTELNDAVVLRSQGLSKQGLDLSELGLGGFFELAKNFRSALSDASLPRANSAAQAMSAWIDATAHAASRLIASNDFGPAKNTLVLVVSNLKGVSKALEGLVEKVTALAAELEKFPAALKYARGCLPDRPSYRLPLFAGKPLDSPLDLSAMRRLNALATSFNAGVNDVSGECPSAAAALSSLLGQAKQQGFGALGGRSEFQQQLPHSGSSKDALSHAVASVVDLAAHELSSLIAPVMDAIKSASASAGSQLVGATTADLFGSVTSHGGGILKDVVCTSLYLSRL